MKTTMMVEVPDDFKKGKKCPYRITRLYGKSFALCTILQFLHDEDFRLHPERKAHKLHKYRGVFEIDRCLVKQCPLAIEGEEQLVISMCSKCSHVSDCDDYVRENGCKYEPVEE